MCPRHAPGGVEPVELLRALADSVFEAWPDNAAVGRAPVRAELDDIVRWMERSNGASESDPPATAGPASGDVLLQRRLLEALRLACLHRWERDELRDDGRACLDLLVRLERRARATLPRDARDFASRLTDPDGFELLLEVAHDLRSPLTSVSFLAETLRGGFSGPLSDQQRHQLGLIYAAAVAMQTVVTDVMDLARHGGDVLDEEPAPFSLSEVFGRVLRMVGPIAEVKGLELRVETLEGDRFLGRPLALGRVLLNLATNGLKFTDQGFVELAAHRVGHDEIEFSVRDTGRGIDPQNQATLFEPFRKARDRPGSFFSGSGLGLSIVRRLVTALGSELRFETDAEWGTRFYFRLHLPSVPHL
jgi:signal transduction histidine kinase